MIVSYVGAVQCKSDDQRRKFLNFGISELQSLNVTMTTDY